LAFLVSEVLVEQRLAGDGVEVLDGFTLLEVRPPQADVVVALELAGVRDFEPLVHPGIAVGTAVTAERIPDPE
jgi:hypothetical protein